MRNFGVNYGLIFLAWGFAGILAPYWRALLLT